MAKKAKKAKQPKRQFSDEETIDVLMSYAEDCDLDVSGIDPDDIDHAMYSLTEAIDGLVSRGDRSECGVYDYMVDCGAWEPEDDE